MMMTYGWQLACTCVCVYRSERDSSDDRQTIQRQPDEPYRQQLDEPLGDTSYGSRLTQRQPEGTDSISFLQHLFLSYT